MIEQLQGVVLAAGRGSRINPIIGHSLIKALLPVNNQPLIFYPLHLLASNGFKSNILIIVQEDHRERIKKATDKICEKLGIHVELFSIVEESEDFGPCESLRQAINAKKIIKDTLILSCDSITNGSIKKLINFHHMNSSDFTALFTPSLPETTIKPPGPKSMSKPEKDLLGIDPNSSEIMFCASEADFDESINFPMVALKYSPHIKVYSSFVDTHIYIIKKSLFDQHLSTKHVSLKGEFLPYLISSSLKEENRKTKINCFAYLERESSSLRINTTYAYSLIHKSTDFLKKSFGVEKNYEREQAFKGSVKFQNASLGENCTFGEKVKVSNTVLMDYIEVGEGVSVENSIVCSGAKVGKNSVLKDCLVGPSYVVQPGSKLTNDSLTVDDDTFFEA